MSGPIQYKIYTDLYVYIDFVRSEYSKIYEYVDKKKCVLNIKKHSAFLISVTFQHLAKLSLTQES